MSLSKNGRGPNPGFSTVDTESDDYSPRKASNRRRVPAEIKKKEQLQRLWAPGPT